MASSLPDNFRNYAIMAMDSSSPRGVPGQDASPLTTGTTRAMRRALVLNLATTASDVGTLAVSSLDWLSYCCPFRPFRGF
jgi:hypothetical protein